jgi:formylglycine-generating enzyme required for sulfatase activity
MAKYEVSQAQWTMVMGSNPAFFQGQGSDPAQLPVEQVSWNDARDFADRTGLALPTEAQWEYACRAGVQGPVPGTGRLEEMTTCGSVPPSWGQPIGTKLPNGFGLHDLQGGVWEWCEDGFDEHFYQRPEAEGPDPVPPGGSALRVVRGNARGDVPWMCRAAVRRAYTPARRINFLGFRPALTLR